MARRDHIDTEMLAQWRADPVAFIEETLIDPETNQPFVLLPAERAFLAHAFLTDTDGKLLYPEQVYGAPKKSGKTAFGAMHVLTTVLLFGGAFPEANIVANDFEQAQSRVFQAIRRIIEVSPLLRSEAKITADKITFPALDITIAAIASDAAGAAGGNQNISAFDELWGYTSERARRLWDECVPPPTRKIACRLTTTYAGYDGESLLLWDLYQRGMAQPLIGDNLRAGDGILFFWTHDPVAPWQDEKWLAEMRRTLRPNAYRRLIRNEFVGSESQFIDMDWYDACVYPDVTPIVADRSLKIFIGVDASVKRDSTAVVAVSFDREKQRARLVTHRIFQPSPEHPLDFEATIESTVLDLHRRFNVVKLYYDPFQMAATAQRLTRTMGEKRIEEYPQTLANLSACASNLYELIKGRNFVFYPDGDVRLAISRAVAVENARGWKISKEKQAFKIDFVVALAMAALAAVRNQSTYSIAAWKIDDDDDEPAPTPEDVEREIRFTMAVRGCSRGDAIEHLKQPMAKLKKSAWGHPGIRI